MTLVPTATAVASRLPGGRWLPRPADGVVCVRGRIDVNAGCTVRCPGKRTSCHRSDHDAPRSGPLVSRCVLPGTARAAETA